MRVLRYALLAPALAMGLTAGGLMADQAGAQQATTVTLSAQNNSGVSGTATLTPMGEQTQVVVQLQNAPGPHPIHFHEGTCENLNPAVRYPLTSVQNGRSETMVNASLQTLLSTPHAVNAHKSPQEASVYVSCGNVTASSGPAQPGRQPGNLPTAGEAENWAIGALAAAGMALLGAGWVARRRAS